MMIGKNSTSNPANHTPKIFTTIVYGSIECPRHTTSATSRTIQKIIFVIILLYSIIHNIKARAENPIPQNATAINPAEKEYAIYYGISRDDLITITNNAFRSKGFRLTSRTVFHFPESSSIGSITILRYLFSNKHYPKQGVKFGWLIDERGTTNGLCSPCFVYLEQPLFHKLSQEYPPTNEAYASGTVTGILDIDFAAAYSSARQEVVDRLGDAP